MSLRACIAAISLVLIVPAAASAAAPGYFDVAKLPTPTVQGKEIADEIQGFSEDFAHRVGGTPIEQSAAAFLAEEARKLGYDTKIELVSVADGDPGTIGRLVIATRKGTTKPDEHLMFMGHYDNVPQTINGAYDNASGTTMIRALAKSMSGVPTNRTVNFIWYSTEEEGLLASEAHAKAWKAEKRGDIKAVLGFDMVGIAYPVATPGAKTCLCIWHGEDDEPFEALIRHINFNVLGFPEGDGLVQFRGVNARNSDERSWDIAGYPVMRWAGMTTAANYPAYHRPDDTMATIESVAGGRSFFEAGLRNTLVSSYLTALALDNAQPVARATASGTGPIAFDATASSDADGPLSRFAWDFGDGTSAVGATAAHTYAKAGTYTARLTVGDNLWMPVTQSIDVPVTVTTPPAAAKKRAKAKRCRKGYKRVTRRGTGTKKVTRCVRKRAARTRRS